MMRKPDFSKAGVVSGSISYDRRRFVRWAGILLLGLLLALPFSTPLAGDGNSASDTLAERRLRALVAEERLLFERLAEDPGPTEVARIRARLHSIIASYNSLISDSPDFAAAYVTYGLLLQRVGERETGLAMLMKANELEPNIPVVKNQIGNFLAEEGEYAKALPYYLAAIELAPEEPLYHYQLGSLLFEYRDFFIEEEMFTREVLDGRMQAAFLRARELSPDTVAFSYRYAESYYDLAEPRWEEALRLWKELETSTASTVEQQTYRLHQANVLLYMGMIEEAATLLEGINEEVLMSNRDALLDRIATIESPP